jgi:hypothetical protein
MEMRLNLGPYSHQRLPSVITFCAQGRSVGPESDCMRGRAFKPDGREVGLILLRMWHLRRCASRSKPVARSFLSVNRTTILTVRQFNWTQSFNPFKRDPPRKYFIFNSVHIKPKWQLIKYGMSILNIYINPLEHVPSDTCKGFFYSSCSHLEHRTSVKLLVLFQFLNLRQSVGFLGRRISPSQDRYLTRTDVQAFSRIRTHDPSVRAGENISCLRPRGHCEGHVSI